MDEPEDYQEILKELLEILKELIIHTMDDYDTARVDELVASVESKIQAREDFEKFLESQA